MDQGWTISSHWCRVCCIPSLANLIGLRNFTVQIVYTCIVRRREPGEHLVADAVIEEGLEASRLGDNKLLKEICGSQRAADVEIWMVVV